MNIEEIKNKVEIALEDKQEFADLCFKLVPQLIEEIERLQVIADKHDKLMDILDDMPIDPEDLFIEEE